jgi:DNA polymerase III epsilon subunit family exonuclease
MPISLLTPLRDAPLAVIDVETTGASVECGHRVTEIGIARVQGGQIFAQYQQLVDPRRPISPGVTALTGITNDMVSGQPTFAEQLPAMLAVMGEAVIVGHNIGFDLGFLRHEFHACGRDIAHAMGNAHVLDTVRIARRRFGRRGNGLQQLCRRLGYSPPLAHRALPDVITTYQVLDRLLQSVGGWDLNLCDALVQQGGPLSLGMPGPAARVLPLALEEALDQRFPVMLEYLDARHRRTRRVVEPIEVRRSGEELVLIAHCHLRNDRRNFKLERIVQLTRVSDEQTTGIEQYLPATPEPQLGDGLA